MITDICPMVRNSSVIVDVKIGNRSINRFNRKYECLMKKNEEMLNTYIPVEVAKCRAKIDLIAYILSNCWILRSSPAKTGLSRAHTSSNYQRVLFFLRTKARGERKRAAVSKGARYDKYKLRSLLYNTWTRV